MTETIKELSKDIIEITTTKIINLKPIKDEIVQINSMLNDFPIKKVKADAETLEFWNRQMVDENMEKSHLLERKRNLEEYLNKYLVK